MFKRLLILLCLVFLPSLALGQEFLVSPDSSLYPTVTNQQSYIPLDSNYAILSYKIVPRGGTTVVSANIIPTVRRSDLSLFVENSIGWYTFEGLSDADGSYGNYFVVISADTIYTRSAQRIGASILSQIQELLIAQNLGTVAQRQALINTFSVQLPTLIEPSALYNSFLKQLQPFIIKFLAVGLILLSVSKGLNYLEKLAAVKHKQREAFRKRGEKIAQARDKEYKLLEDWTVAAAVRYVENPTRISRKEFYEQLKEYNEYRASKGWKY